MEGENIEGVVGVGGQGRMGSAGGEFELAQMNGSRK